MKQMKYALTLTLLLAFVLQTAAFAAEQQAELDLTATSAVLIDSTTGQVLYSKNPDEHLPIASVTKTMTMLLVMEALYSGRITLDDMVVTSEYASSMGGSQVFLSPGEQMSVSDMLKALAVASGNDAAVALAEHMYGSEQSFVAEMNRKVEELGLHDTHFVNCNGLDAENHYSSAHDVAVFSRELAKYPLIFDYTSIWMDSLRNGAFGLANTNKMIRFYNGANGLKTGSTSQAHFCVSASAKRDNMQLIAVVLGAPTSNDRFNDAKALLDYGFANYAVEQYVSAGEHVADVTVSKGVADTVGAVAASDFAMLISKSKKASVETEVVLEESVSAPVVKDQKIGEVIVRADGKEIDRIDVVAAADVEKIGFWDSFRMLFRSFSRR